MEGRLYSGDEAHNLCSGWPRAGLIGEAPALQLPERLDGLFIVGGGGGEAAPVEQFLNEAAEGANLQTT